MSVESKYIWAECAYSLAKVITDALKEEGIAFSDIWEINNAIKERSELK